MQISTFIKNYERDLQLKNYANNSIKNYVSQIGSFLSRFIEKDSPKHISVSEIKDYLLTAKEINSQKHMQSAIRAQLIQNHRNIYPRIKKHYIKSKHTHLTS